MQYQKNQLVKKIFLSLILFIAAISSITAQVSAVEFGKNRLQFKKFKWQYYQTQNFNTYFNQNGQELAKYVAQVAEKELPSIEQFTEYSLQRRANIVIYNSFNDMKQSNIGMGIDWQNTGGVTKLVNNKMLVYFNGDHNDLRRQVREGLAGILTQSVLFGDDLGEFASNQALLDLPQWLTDGYIAYAGENWNTSLDDDLRSEMLSGKYRNFYQFAFDKPQLAGHAFWFYIEERYKRENTTYLLYLARVYKNLNKATLQIAKKKFKALLADFMDYEGTKYDRDVARRRYYPKGSEIISVTIGKRTDYFHFNVNPNKRNSSFAVVQFKKGQYKLILNEDDEDKTLLKFDVRSNGNDINPNYPMMAWDPLGKRLSVLYSEQGKIKLFVYDAVTKHTPYNRDLTNYFQQVQDMKYMLDYKRLVMSAVKNGHTDIFTYDIENDKVKQITNDIYDDLDPAYVSLPNKEGIIFSSNRPSPYAVSADTVLPNNRYNIFLVTDFNTNNAALNRVTQLTNLRFGNARFPTQYNTYHFTFVNDENGIANRYAGFFSSQREGFDTLVVVGDDVLRNPSTKEIDSALRINKKRDVDTIAVVSVSKDSAYIFPLTNYASNLRETRIAGENNQVSEVTRQGDEKTLYKLKIDENTLRRRNVTTPPTAYMKRILQQDKIAHGLETTNLTDSATKKPDDIFQNEFGNEKKDSASTGQIFSAEDPSKSSILSRAKLFPYNPPKFATDYLVSGFNNSVLVTRYQLYGGGAGPISLGSSTPINGLIRVGTSDIMEDLKFSGGFRLSTNLKDNDWLFQFQNLRRRVDWGVTYYRNVQQVQVSTTSTQYVGKLISNLYQTSVTYPFDEVRSLRINVGVRRDRLVLFAGDISTLDAPDIKTLYGLAHMEYVYDNTLNPAQNIWEGSRYKIYMDFNRQLNSTGNTIGKNTYNFGFDARTYYPIYRNFIWAGRIAADLSWGDQKLIYYLGGVDNWMMFGSNVKSNGSYRYFNDANKPAPDQAYAYQSLAVNMRGFIQNAANGNNALVMNSEFRLPVFSTLFSKPINNAFLRNFQLIQFIDLGSAWNGKYNNLSRPSVIYGSAPVQVNIKAGGIGPFLGGYGFGARSTILGYFLKADAGWQMNGLFKGKPILYLSMGLDF